MAIELCAGDARVHVDPEDGCRLTSLRIGDDELLAAVRPEPWGHGSPVMAPWAGRLRDGHVRWGGRERRYPVQEDGHALHGLVHSVPWTQVADDTWAVTVDDSWVAPCTIRQRIHLDASALHLTLEVHAEDGEVPATVGWHPWFRRRLDGGAELELEVTAEAMLEKEPDGSTSQRRVAVPPRPWDDTFVGLGWPVRLRWPGVLDLTVDSDAPVAVLFDELEQALCVEPQSGAPNEVNLAPRTAAPGRPLTLTSTWRWATTGHSA